MKTRRAYWKIYIWINIFRIPLKYSADDIQYYCYKAIEINKNLFSYHDEHRLMIDVPRGLLGIYEGISN